MSAPEQEVGEPKKIPAVRYDCLTNEVLDGVLGVYWKVIFGKEIKDRSSTTWTSRFYELIRVVRNRSFSEPEFSSRRYGHSKLRIRQCRGDFDDDIVAFVLYDNLEQDDPYKERAVQLAEQFAIELTNHLAGKGLLFSGKNLQYRI